ncbi:MAG: response regulator [Maricaulaceae bacterium]|nr:response regulator [Maricaulaceae bacterium]
MAVDMSRPVLVVDDYDTMVRIIRSLLKQLGFTNIEGATSGGEALQKLKGGGYGLVISDCKMEPMSGIDLLQTVRADEALKDTPFIIVTADTRTENVITAKKAGVNNYIVKPFNVGTLKTKIAAVLGEF